MKSNEDMFLKNIANLSYITSMCDVDNRYREVIRALSFFLSKTNKNYYYTETFLNDTFNNFEEFLEKFIKKNEFSKKMSTYIEQQFKKDDDQLKVTILIDNIWILEYDKNTWIRKIKKNGDLNSLLNNSTHITYTLLHRDKIIEMYEKIDTKYAEENQDTESCKSIVNNLMRYYEALESKGDKSSGNRNKQIKSKRVV